MSMSRTTRGMWWSPPSRHRSGGTYEWLNWGTPIAVWPECDPCRRDGQWAVRRPDGGGGCRPQRKNHHALAGVRLHPVLSEPLRAGRQATNGSRHLLAPASRSAPVQTVVFAPEGCEPNQYNLWRGFAVKPKKGDCSLYLAHLRWTICRGNAEHFVIYSRGWRTSSSIPPIYRARPL